MVDVQAIVVVLGRLPQVEKNITHSGSILTFRLINCVWSGVMRGECDPKINW